MSRFNVPVSHLHRWMKSLSFQSRLSHRLAGGFGLLLLLLVLTVGLALFQMAQMQAQMRSVAESNVERIIAAQAMLDAVNKVSVASLSFSLASDAADVDFQKNEVVTLLKSYEAAQRHFEELGQAAGMPAIPADVRQRLRESVRDAQQFADVISRMAQETGNAAAAMSSLNPTTVQQLWVKDIEALVVHERAQGRATYQNAREAFERTRAMLIGVAVIAVLIGVVVAAVILRSVTRPIQRAIAHARRVAGGDLTGVIEVSGHDEMSDLLRTLSTMQDHLRRMIGKVRDASGQIRCAAQDISAGGRDLSTRTEQTASNLQQTSASMEHLSALVDEGVQAGHEVKQWVGSATAVAAKGGDVMLRVVSTMEQIDQSSRRIAQIVAVIDGIAFQTNILALNAAVEAARAGEEGRGFAVVATEVRNLAGRSGEAAREIRGLITDSVERVASGADLVRQAGSTMSEIVDAVDCVRATIEKMTATLDAQRQGMGEMSAAVSQVDHMTQQNAAMAEQSSASTSILEGQSARLDEAIDVFKA